MSVAPRPVLFAKQAGLRQFVKFGIVGASSTIINFAVLNLCLRFFHVTAASPIWQTTVSLVVAFLFANINGYVWNSRWTFRNAPLKARRLQILQFLIVGAIGCLINTRIGLALTPVLAAAMHVSHVPAVNMAQAVATVGVMFWNFFANRFWTFKA